MKIFFIGFILGFSLVGFGQDEGSLTKTLLISDQINKIDLSLNATEAAREDCDNCKTLNNNGDLGKPITTNDVTFTLTGEYEGKGFFDKGKSDQ